ncbi:sterol carrier family protein [Tsukamurella sp. 8F]|uniref:sterol carrier family protein n=1 Tax=unclassified Tsukamurella TaxID=2633480 RepID=UPI0023B8FD28|nr:MULTISPECIES: sterol carrier family protein [unclassified Tsukamurella]MDF0528408.1 sterol carrier family protein [Tsukamurella sp. 8J]MDF0586233.1 sterol carrier family protein [Tsukamurella sp. 8F]
MAKAIDPLEMREAVLAVAAWIGDASVPEPSRTERAAAVRLTARMLEQDAPGGSVEVRVPPFAAVQCIEGPRHTRGTPPNVVEADPHTWLRLATGLETLDEAHAAGRATVSGSRAGEIQRWLPLLPLPD